MPQGVTRSNRVLKIFIKDQHFFHPTREFCTILAHWQRRSKSEIAKFKEVPGNLVVTKKLQTRIPIVKRVFFLRNDTVTKNVVVRCSRGTLRGPTRLRLGSRSRGRCRPRRIRVHRCRRRCSWLTPALTRSRMIPLCVNLLKLHESFGCSKHSTFLRARDLVAATPRGTTDLR